MNALARTWCACVLGIVCGLTAASVGVRAVAAEPAGAPGSVTDGGAATAETIVVTRPGYQWCTESDTRQILIEVTDHGGDGAAPLALGHPRAFPSTYFVDVTSPCPAISADPRSRPEFVSRAEDLSYVYEQLCVGTPPPGIPGIDPSRFDCDDVLLWGVSNGAITVLLLANECLADLPLVHAVDVVVTSLATFTPVGGGGRCPAGSPYTFGWSARAFAMQATCDDRYFPIADAAPWWSTRAPTFFRDQTGDHRAADEVAVRLFDDVVDHYLFGGAAAGADLVTLTEGSDILYRAPWGSRLAGGVCGLEPAFTG